MAADGSITAVVDIDDKEAQRQLDKLKKSIENLELDTKTKEATRKRLEEERKSVEAAYKSSSTDNVVRRQALEKEYDALTGRIERLNEAIKENGDAAGVLKDQYGMLEKKLSGVIEEEEEMGDAGEESGERMSEAMRQATSRLEKLEKRIVGLAKRVFVFSLVTMALRNMRTWLAKSVKSNNEAAAAIAKLKGALLTMAQPILQVVIPAFIALVNVLTKVVTAIASLFSMLAGRTPQQSADAAEGLYEEQNAIKEVGSAAKKSSKQLAAFDEINKLTGEIAAGGGGVEAAEIKPDFDLSDLDETMLNRILGIVEAIGAALAAWKISSALGLGLDKAIALFGALYLAIQFVKDIFDAWANGITWGKLGALFAELLASALLLGYALGPVAAGIELVVGGLALLALGIHDAMANGMNWINTLTMIAGILAAGLGISLLTGSWIPLLIAAFASVLLAIVQFTGHGEELMNGLRKVFDGFIQFIKGVFSGDMESALEGIKLMWEGLKESAKAIWKSIKDAWKAGSEWVVSTVQNVWESFKQWWSANAAKYFTSEYWQDLGAKMLEGLFQGLSNVKNKVTEWGREIIRSVRNVLGIHSPSTEFEEIGEYALAGLANGMKDTKALAQSFDTMMLQMSASAQNSAKQMEASFDAATKTTETTFKSAADRTTTLIKKVLNYWQQAMQNARATAQMTTNAMMTMFWEMSRQSVSAIDAIIAELNAIPRNIVTVHTIITEHEDGGGSGGSGGTSVSSPSAVNAAAPRLTIPALAAGSVIPPNREFLAVLGDQKRGTNIEAPLDTIVQAFRAAIGEQNGGRQTIVLQLDRRELGRAVADVSKLESQRVGLKLGGAY